MAELKGGVVRSAPLFLSGEEARNPCFDSLAASYFSEFFAGLGFYKNAFFRAAKNCGNAFAHLLAVRKKLWFFQSDNAVYVL